MKNYTITVNGNVYDVTVEEGATTGTMPSKAAPKPAQAPAPKAAPKAAGGAGAVKIEAGAAGKIFKLPRPCARQLQQEVQAGGQLREDDHCQRLRVLYRRISAEERDRPIGRTQSSPLRCGCSRPWELPAGRQYNDCNG